MRRRHKTHCMATVIQFLYNWINNFVQLHLGFIDFTPVATDLVILTIDARKITTAEKHITNTIGSADYRFFSMVNKDGTDVETCVAAANTNFSMQPVGTAIARTNIAAG